MANHDDLKRDFALSLPPALLSISPTLASVHAARAQRLYTEVGPADLSFCRECRGYLDDGIGAHRTRRLGARSKRTKAAPRRLHVHCSACGADNAFQLPESVAQFPMPRARARALPTREAREPTYPQPVVEPASILASAHLPRPSEDRSQPSSATPRSASPGTPPPPEPNAQSKPKKRPKNKAGLQELLARKKQSESSKATTTGNALSSFLSEL